jgi:hypothetical protein
MGVQIVKGGGKTEKKGPGEAEKMDISKIEKTRSKSVCV